MSKHLRIIWVLMPLIGFTGCVTREPTLKDIDGPPTMASSVQQAPEVRFCDLVLNPDRYDNSIIRTKAVMHVDRENEFLYDPQCDKGNAGPIWADYDPSYIYSDERVKQRLTELIRPRLSQPSRSAQVTVVGRFEGPGGGPYGHLDGYPSRFSIMRIEQAEIVQTLAASAY